MNCTCVDNNWEDSGEWCFWEGIWLGSPGFQAPATGVGGAKRTAFFGWEN